MKLTVLPNSFSVCKLSDEKSVPYGAEFTFIAKTDEEISLVCPTEDVPSVTLERVDGWRAFRVAGVLDFSLIGVLAKISAVLADEKIGIFVVSTFNTDYVLIKEENFASALSALRGKGYDVDEV